jgi:hypothetical protein
MTTTFYFNNGFNATNINELISCLENLDENTFKYHCNNDKNDFFNWINLSLNDKKTANAIKKIKTRKGMIKKLNALK